MKTLINRVVLFAAGALVLGSAAYGQTLKANVPFAFSVGSTQLPAGHYTVTQKNESGAGIVRLWNETSRHAYLSRPNPREYELSGTPRLSFLCANGNCSLHEIRTSEGASSYPAPRRAAPEKQALSVVSISLTAATGE